MIPGHIISEKLEISVIDILDPKILIRRTDTGTSLTLNEDAWNAFFKFTEEINSFFEGQNRRFHLWLPIDDNRIKLECFKNSSGNRIIDLRSYERGSENQYFMLFSTSHGFSLKKSHWEILLALKPILDREIMLKNAARLRTKDLILQHLTSVLFDITANCSESDCHKSIAHSQSCSKVNSDWADRIDVTLKQALPEIDRDKIIEHFRRDYGFEEEEHVLFNYCISNVIDLKNALLFGY